MSKRAIVITLVSISFIVLVGVGVFTFVMRSSRSPGCPTCGEKAVTTTGSEELTLEQALRTDYAEKLASARQGLAEGEVAPTITGVQFAEGPTIVYDWRPDEKPSPASDYLFASVLRDWAKMFEGLQIVLVISGPTAEAFANVMDSIVEDQVTVILDPFGKIRANYELLNFPRGMLFLVDQDGSIVGRARGIQEENWYYLSQVVEAHARGESPKTENMPFAVRHPKSTLGNTVQIAGLTDISGNPAPVDMFRGQVTMVYFFAPYCQPCAVATEVTKQLHEEFGDRVQFIGLAHVLSRDTVYWAHICATRYDAKESWAWTIPEGNDGAQRYVEERVVALKDYIVGIEFPVLIDWDDRVMGAWGMGLCGFPSWAILDHDGRLVQMVPGGAMWYNRNGQRVETTSPPVDWLREMLSAALTIERSR